MSHQRDHDRALKRGGGTMTLSLDVEAGERNYAATPIDRRDPGGGLRPPLGDDRARPGLSTVWVKSEANTIDSSSS